jgi:hypothetical protein
MTIDDPCVNAILERFPGATIVAVRMKDAQERLPHPKCHYCARPLDGKPGGKFTRDHKIPRSRGGSDADVNIVPCCEQCNRTKAAMTDVEFIAWRASGMSKKEWFILHGEPPRLEKPFYVYQDGRWIQNPKNAALVAQWIEQGASTTEVAGSSPAECATKVWSP